MWNNALKLFIEMKNRVRKKFGEEALWDYTEKTCLDHWAELCPEFQEVLEPLSINEYNEMVLLKYDSLDVNDEDFWNRYDGLYRECRSVVIDKYKDCLIMAPYRKFFNMNEQPETVEAEVRKRLESAKSVEISDKMDGSMQSVRYYNGKIILTGSEALNPQLSFRVKYGYDFLTESYQEMVKDYPDYTFVFEFIHHEDQHLVRYKKDGLYLTGMRSVINGKCLPYREVIAIAEKYGVLHTVVFDKTLDQCLAELDKKESYEAEGWVIDIDGFKIKLKYNDYVCLHKYLSKVLSPNMVIKCVHEGNLEDIRCKLPVAYQKNMDEIANEVKDYLKYMNHIAQEGYKKCMQAVEFTEDQKENKKRFAHEAKKYKAAMPYIMNLYIGKENDFLNKHGLGCYRLGEIRERKEQIAKDVKELII